eukprot:CAMPEP_0119079766 /NCGR_PEP_ID=MMETSP1178-20130426/109142_1 /TAXON_ID=33656 /ORGANISM="unid sp, Strain CCMP2000" /LENGTH=83 /DNA_ID=CAMNT_0007062309 /DNA_START=12 /DNA_END=259 /DNA_ORIENTATION=+
MARQFSDVPRVHVSGARESLVRHRRQPQLGHVGTLEAVALCLAELGERHAEAPLLAALRIACDEHEDAEVRSLSPEMLEIKRA